MSKEFFSFGDEEMADAEERWVDTEDRGVAVLDKPASPEEEVDLGPGPAEEGAKRSRGDSRPVSSDNRRPSPRRDRGVAGVALVLGIALLLGIAITVFSKGPAPTSDSPTQPLAPSHSVQQKRVAAAERAQLRAERERERQAERQRATRHRAQTRRRAKRQRARRIANQRRQARQQRAGGEAQQGPTEAPPSPAPPPPTVSPEIPTDSPPAPEQGGGLRDGSVSPEFGL